MESTSYDEMLLLIIHSRSLTLRTSFQIKTSCVTISVVCCDGRVGPNWTHLNVKHGFIGNRVVLPKLFSCWSEEFVNNDVYSVGVNVSLLESHGLNFFFFFLSRVGWNQMYFFLLTAFVSRFFVLNIKINYLMIKPL